MAEETTKTVIAEDVEIVGTLKCTGNIRLDGKLNGDLGCQGNAVIGASAKVKGNLSVDSVAIEGQVSGNITAKDRIEMKSTAHVNGDIRSKRLTVQDGVTFVGKSEVNPSGVAAQRPAGDGKPPDSQPRDAGGQETAEAKGKQDAGSLDKK
ncbi:MAG: polymer-forming cytoskeletal protein [Kiritimatiellia bacterium]|nr:polymer-forming cytoskeletal protein [Kiritimatiellia bacterium]